MSDTNKNKAKKIDELYNKAVADIKAIDHDMASQNDKKAKAKDQQSVDQILDKIHNQL
jgi:hypothetical protein